MEFDLKGVFSFRHDGESPKNAFSTQLDDLHQQGFLRCLEKPTQNGGMKPTSWNSIPRVFFRFAPMGKVQKTHFQRNWTTFINKGVFALLEKAQPKWWYKTDVVEFDPKGVFSFHSLWGNSKKRVLNAIGGPSSTMVLALLGKAQAKWWYDTDLVEFDPKGFFSFRPDGES